MTDNNQTFKLYDPSGTVIMTGSMSAIMERLPDTKARDDAVGSMLETAIKAVEAEERADEARASVASHLCDGLTRLAARLDSFEKARSISMKRAEAEQLRRDRQRVQSYLDQMPDPDQPDVPEGNSDLTAHASVDPEKYDTEEEMTEHRAIDEYDPDDPGTWPENNATSVPSTKATGPDPEPAPEPGSRLYEGPPQVAQPVSISLNAEQ